LLILCCGLLLPGLAPPAAAEGQSPHHSALKTAEGKVLAVSRIAGEGGIEVVQVSLAPDGDREHPLLVLLAPPDAMKEIGFSVETGDQLKVKYFVSEEGTCKAHKVLNSSRGLMVRLRTLRQVPLWNNQGHWQGGQGRMRHGPGPGRGGS
jgi:hypothetical protein